MRRRNQVKPSAQVNACQTVPDVAVAYAQCIAFYQRYAPQKAPDLSVHAKNLIDNYTMINLLTSFRNTYGAIPEGWEVYDPTPQANSTSTAALAQVRNPTQERAKQQREARAAKKATEAAKREASRAVQVCSS